MFSQCPLAYPIVTSPYPLYYLNNIFLITLSWNQVFKLLYNLYVFNKHMTNKNIIIKNAALVEARVWRLY